MTTIQRTNLENEASFLAADSEFGAAADMYVRASFEELGESFGAASWAMELRVLFKACLCYRLADQARQCRFVARLGIGLAEEYAERRREKPEPSHPPDQAERGVWDEFVGDFRLVAGFDGVADAYDSAMSIYKEVGDPDAHYAEGPIMSVQGIFSTVVLVAGADDEHITNSTEGKLTDWVEYKRNHMESLIENIVASGEWKLPK